MLASELAAFGTYCNAIVDAWDDRRGRDMPPETNLGWTFMRQLWTEGVPLRIVLRGIKDCGGKIDANSILYAKPAILAEIDRWAKAQTF